VLKVVGRAPHEVAGEVEVIPPRAKDLRVDERIGKRLWFEGPRVFRTSEFAVILRSSLHFQVLVHGLLRGPVSDCGMKTLPIIAQLDVARDILMRCPACRVDGTVHLLDFQRTIERFCERVVIADSGPADRLAYPRAFSAHPRTRPRYSCFRGRCGILPLRAGSCSVRPS
jgi:hypothetical protein